MAKRLCYRGLTWPIVATVFVVLLAGCTSRPTVSSDSSPSPDAGRSGTYEYAWTQLGAGSTVAVRSVTEGTCPEVVADRVPVTSRVFANATPNFPLRTCEAEISPTAREVTVSGSRVPGPPQKLDRVVVVGDIGCYMKKEKFQACLDPAQFPARELANQIAAARPDLVIFVGDIYYSQVECPPDKASECGGVPTGDNWAAWAYDFFAPYQPALTAAPWIFVRGNHESCGTPNDNGGPGWFQILAQETGGCSNNTDPYRVDVLGQSIVVFDSAIADDNPANAAQVPAYESNFRKVHELTQGHPNAWFADHRPLWAAAPGKDKPWGLNLTLQAAIGDSGNTLPSDVSLILSGHVHALAYYTFSDGRPPQIVSGGGSAVLTHDKGKYSGQTVDGISFQTGELTNEFGFVQMDRAGGAEAWNLDYITLGGAKWKQCELRGRSLSCS